MTNIAVVSFSGGEVSPEVDARKDIEKFTSSCRVLQNMIPDIYGNATRRPGTEKIAVGNGSGCYYEAPVADPAKIQITTPQELQDMADDLTEDYELMNNLDMTGFDWTPIGAETANPLTSFTGTFDGQFFTINNLTIIADSRLTAKPGMFGSFHTGVIENVILDNVDITGEEQSFCGMLADIAPMFAGQNKLSATITQCRVQGTISRVPSPGQAQSWAGIVGRSNGNLATEFLTIERCSSDITIICDDGMGVGTGGLVANFAGVITDSYSTGSITATGTITDGGGAFGRTGLSVITNCYCAVTLSGAGGSTIGGFVGDDNTGVPSTFADCFWDDDVAPTGFDDIENVGDVANITKKTTPQMQTQSTFTNWDFDDVWKIDEGNDYPRHRWTQESDIKAVCKRL